LRYSQQTIYHRLETEVPGVLFELGVSHQCPDNKGVRIEGIAVVYYAQLFGREHFVVLGISKMELRSHRRGKMNDRAREVDGIREVLEADRRTHVVVDIQPLKAWERGW
jgi:hypothetical protein